ncbi:MAG: aminopeptidase P family protein, partial [Bacteroidales bacterium]|nr:aminopeptidase P family protein [Bacteroidales bacterium]
MAVNLFKSRLASVRSVMKKKSIDALIVPSSDPHLGEYVPDHWRVIRWLTGFTGSAATVVITRSFAGLWTDSRYFIQAEEQLKDSGFKLVRLKVPHTPEHIGWIADTMKKGSRVAVDGRLISAVQMILLKARLAENGVKLTLKGDLVSWLWNERPDMPGAMAFTYPVEYAGESRSEKITRVRQRMEEMKIDFHLLTSCDDIMWLLNIRGADVTYSPLLLSFAIVSARQVLLFASEEKIPAVMKGELDNDGVVLLPYDMTGPVLNSLPKKCSILLNPATTSAALYRALPGGARVTGEVSIPTRLKAIKNETEIRNLREVMIRDGVALTSFFYWLEKNIGSGTVTELSASAKLEALRLEQEGCIGPSFATIAAWNGHGALPHYVPSPETDAMLGTSGIFLLDSGGQYYGGTTDTTRTIAVGKPDSDMKRDFTLALKGTIGLAMVKFPYGTRGYQIEVLARKALWDNGLNYGHGTGHGVGSFLNVHEGPQTIGSAANGDLKTVLEPGMVTSDEPAIYREGRYGFRTENLILCVDDSETEHGRFLKFETVTLCHIDSSLVEVSLLDEKELHWLNSYHEKVWSELSPRLAADERKWLRAKTLP